MRSIPPRISSSLERDLRSIVGERHVLTTDADRFAYNNDCWPRGIILSRGRRLHPRWPLAIVQPRNADEIARIVTWARRTSTPIVPFGAGSGVCGGATDEGRGIIVDLKRLDHPITTCAPERLMRVGAGVIGMPLERELDRRGWTLGHYPSSILCSSVGGWIAGRGAGQYSSLYGKIEDMVTSMQVITGHGEIIETAGESWVGSGEGMLRRSIPSPDPTQLFIGSEGTLGIITEATCMIAPKPSLLSYRGFQFDSIEAALDAIRGLFQQGLRPAVVRLYDALDSIIARRGAASRSFAPGIIKRLGAWAGEEMTAEVSERFNTIALGLMGRILGQPLMLNTMIEALPTDCLLILGFEGDTSSVEIEADYAFDVTSRLGHDLGPEPGLHWLSHRYDVSYKQSPLYASGAFVDTMEVSTTWANLATLYQNVREAMADHAVIMAHFSHVYSEGSSIYFTFTGWGADLDETLERYDAAWKAGLDAVARSGGSIAHHHGIGLSKSPWTAHDHPGGAPLFGALKRTFDPNHIMNPGKVWPLGTEEMR